MSCNFYAMYDKVSFPLNQARLSYANELEAAESAERTTRTNVTRLAERTGRLREELDALLEASSELSCDISQVIRQAHDSFAECKRLHGEAIHAHDLAKLALRQVSEPVHQWGLVFSSVVEAMDACKRGDLRKQKAYLRKAWYQACDGLTEASKPYDAILQLARNEVHSTRQLLSEKLTDSQVADKEVIGLQRLQAFCSSSDLSQQLAKAEEASATAALALEQTRQSFEQAEENLRRISEPIKAWVDVVEHLKEAVAGIEQQRSSSS